KNNVNTKNNAYIYYNYHFSTKTIAMINEYIEDIKNLKKELSEDSCSKKEPFIKLGSGQAPTLNYNIPQSACFNTYGHLFVKGIREEVFQSYTKETPEGN